MYSITKSILTLTVSEIDGFGVYESKSLEDGMFDETDVDGTETSNKTDIEAGIYYLNLS